MKGKNPIYIWSIVCILLVSLAMMFSMLSAQLYSWMSPEEKISSLVLGNILQADTVSRTGAGKETEGSDLFTLAARTNDRSWDMENEIDLFSASHINVDGLLTVESGNEEKIIAPGTIGVYEFRVENTSDSSILYTLKGESLLTDNYGETVVPLVIRLRDDSRNFSIGSAESYAALDALNEMSEAAMLHANSYREYALEWYWPYESELDEQETDWGNLAVEEDLRVTIRLTVHADQLDTAGIEQIQTSVSSHLKFWLLMLMLSIFLSVMLKLRVHPIYRPG